MKKVIVSLFILFHWLCVTAWVLPKPSPFKTWLLTLRIPTSSRYLVESYLFTSAQWQDWSMFAPNPLAANRYLAAIVTFENGKSHKFFLPRLSQLNFVSAWLEKRYRKYQHRIMDENFVSFSQDLARYIARQTRSDTKIPSRVMLYRYEAPIPRHDRPELVSTVNPPWVNYTALLRDHANYKRHLLLDYAVKAEDLQ